MATDFYVNPNGNDTWTGNLQQANAARSNGPFKTLERAKAAIRTLKQTKQFTDQVTVNIAGGLYYLNNPLTFNLIDSGMPGKEILWQGQPGAKVTISGGLPITCKKRDTTFWDCPVTTLPASTAHYDARIKGNGPKFELFVNGQRLEVARWPDKDWAHIKLPLDQTTTFTVMEAMPPLTGNNSNAQVHILAGNDWYDQYLGISSIDGVNNAVKLSAATVYPLVSGRRFYIQNLASLLNAPGEWFYEPTTKKVSFIPPTGITPTLAILSSQPKILIADGISNVTFKNISFQHSTGSAITVKNSTNVVMDNLDVNNTGGLGVEIINGQSVQLINSKIHDIGATAVTVSGGDTKTLKASGHIINNNHIHDMSKVVMTYRPAIEIKGVGVTVTHNLLEQGAHNAITIAGNDHLIEKNEIHHFCLQTSDCGSVYTGRNWSWRGNIIRNNYLHDIIGYGMTKLDLANNQVVYGTGGARGVYLDDGASGYEVSSNIFENAGQMALLIGGGRDNVIANNLFSTSEFAILLDNRWPTFNWNDMQSQLDASPYKTAIWQQKYPGLAVPMHNKTWPEGNRIERNIIMTTKPNGASLRYMVPIDSTVIADNLVLATSGKPKIEYKISESNKDLGTATWEQWIAEGIEKNSLVADPCVTIANKQMTTCSGSPVDSIGFTPLATDIGLLP